MTITLRCNRSRKIGSHFTPNDFSKKPTASAFTFRLGQGDYEDSEDWEQGIQGSWNLTVKGIAKLREEIRREEKWRRESRQHWAAFLSALGGVIGTVIGLVSILRR